MTLPESPPALDRGHIKVLVGAAAWNYHEALPAELRADLDLAYRVHGSELLVAADLLETVCLAASRKAASSGGGVKRMKDGTEEMEFFQAQSEFAVDAGAWCKRAAELRAQAEAKAAAAARVSANPEPVLEPWEVDW